MLRRRPLSLAVLLFAGILSLLTPASAQMTTDQQAEMVLSSARRAYNEKNFPFAIARFREFLAKFGGHRDANNARYGLALALLDGPDRNFDQALENLNPLVGSKTFSDYPYVLYYSGLARRGQALKATDPNVARQRFEEASRNFADAAAAFVVKVKETPKKEAATVQEWAYKSTCDEAEMLLRLKKPKDAQKALRDLVADKGFAESRYHAQGQYYFGFASFQLGEMFAAGKALSRKDVLSDESFGTHARYLVGRVHQLNTKQNEREEARQAYQAVLKDHEAAVKDAKEKMRNPDALKNDPERKDRLERLSKGITPDHVSRAGFFLGELQYQDGRYAEALEFFKTFIKENPKSPFLNEALLRSGYCQVQLKQNDDAIKTLAPLAEKFPTLADQATYWMAKAELNRVDTKKPDAYNAALSLFSRAAEKAQQRIQAAPEDRAAKELRGDILVDLAAAQQLAKKYRDAANTYMSVLNEKLLPTREDEVLLEQATAYQLAGEYSESDKVCGKFLDRHKDSTLVATLLFRQAENSAFQALAAEKLPNPADRDREMNKFNDESIKRYSALIEKYPENAGVNLARQGLGMAHLRKGELALAQKTLESIGAGDRGGDLATVNFNLADIYLRQLPTKIDDAVSAGKLEAGLKSASDALEAFIGGSADSPLVPEALLKLGYCQQRMGKLLAKPEEQQKLYGAARATYERITSKHGTSPAAAQAIFERAKVMALQRDPNGAMNELRRFANDPLSKSPIAPMALLHLATLQRGQNRFADAAKTLEDCRKAHDEALRNDKTRAAWGPILLYHHATALREAGQFSDARTRFEELSRATGDTPEIFESAYRMAQCEREASEKKIAEARKQLANPGLNAEQRAKAEGQYNTGLQELRQAANTLTTQEQNLRRRKVENEDLSKVLASIRSRMMYEAAWAWRSVAELEIESARKKTQLELWQKKKEELARLTPAGQTPPTPPMPEVTLEMIAPQAAEKEVRSRYEELIKTFPEANINADARFELAEVLSTRNQLDEATKLLQGALEGEKEPSQELTERIKTRLGTALLDRGARKIATAAQTKAAAKKLDDEGKKDIEAALEQLQTVTANDKSAMLAQASYREAECQLQLGKADEAIKLLSKFRDHGPWQNLPGLSDRALLRLGAALADQKKWEPSRQAYEAMLGRFWGSVWANDARYGMAWALQNLGRYDDAINNYGQVANATATRLGARAQMNIGLCRMMQKRYSDASTALLVVPYTYDYGDLNALALVEAARAFSENKQNDQAVKLLKKVIKEHAGTDQAEAAAKRLKELGDS
jgi:TolA-binding protein